MGEERWRNGETTVVGRRMLEIMLLKDLYRRNSRMIRIAI